LRQQKCFLYRVAAFGVSLFEATVALQPTHFSYPTTDAPVDQNRKNDRSLWLMWSKCFRIEALIVKSNKLFHVIHVKKASMRPKTVFGLGSTPTHKTL